jgi:DNA polymerase III gamma/tau subunit
MDKILFLHIEIKNVLEMFKFISKEDRIKLTAAIANETYENLLALLKTLYKIEREYFQFIHKDVVDTEKFLATLKSIHDK